MKLNTRLIISLAVPILCLAAFVVYKAAILALGVKLVLPVSGYDPRDLLSGHYLTYRVDYNRPDLCRDSYASPGDRVYVCVRQKGEEGVESEVIRSLHFIPAEGCTAVIRGVCDERGRFTAGIERFYIPEKESAMLERIVWDRKAMIVVKVDKNGTAVVQDMLFDGMPMNEFLKKHRNEKRR